MLNDQRASTSHGNSTEHDDADDQDQQNNEQIREIHALTPPRPHHRREQPWETHSHQSSIVSMAATEGAASSDNFASISREFSALVLAGSSIDHNNSTSSIINGYGNEGAANGVNNNNLGRIGEDDLMMEEETNPLAIVPDNNPLNPVSSPRRGGIAAGGSSSSSVTISGQSEVSVQRVKKEEVEAKISAWQNAKVAKINNRLKREDAVINGWESEQVQKATSRMKKVERKLEEKRARSMEKMQNEVAKARRKAEERRASAEAKRGTKVARVLEVANLMRAVGRAPTKRSFFKAV